MQIDSLLICRANGKVYEKLRISDLNDIANTITIIMNDDDASDHPIVPARLYRIENAEACAKTAIAVYPIMPIRSGSFIVAEFSDNREPLSQSKHAVDFEHAKWKSRINYRTKRSECDDIRLVDERELEYGDRGIKLLTAIGTDSHLLLRLEISRTNTPDYADWHNTQISCVNNRGEKTPIDVTFMGSSASDLQSGELPLLTSYTFTVSVPWNQGDLYFVASIKNKPVTTFIQAIRRDEYEFMLSQTDGVLYQSAYSDPYYCEWLNKHKPSPYELDCQRDSSLGGSVQFSIIVPLYNTPVSLFQEMLSSVLAQTYPNWELILVNASPDDIELGNMVLRASADDKRIHNINLSRNGGISLNTNEGIHAANGDFVCFLDHDDLLEQNALFEYTKAIIEHRDIDLLYCDEDKLSPSGEFVNPFFKPDFSIDLLRNNNYICHFLAIRKTLLDELPLNTPEYDGAQDYNLILNAIERARYIHHVPKILYHWRINETSTAGNAEDKPYATKAGIKALEEHLNRVGLSAIVEKEERPFTYKVFYEAPRDEPLVSIIIPTKDHIELLDSCLSSIDKLSTYSNYEIVVVENNSVERETFDYYKALSSRVHDTRLRIISWTKEFNFSKIINFGAQHANGEYLLLLNNDTEVITPNWIEIMLGIASRSEVGAVGVKLFYPDGTLQHAGVGFGDDIPAHFFRNLPRGKRGYFCLDDAQRNVSAVTAACLMTRKSVFSELGGFNEMYAVAYNDVDYCLRLRKKGYLITYTPEVELYHYESISRGLDTGGTQRIRYIQELARLHYDWASFFAQGDPYYTPNLRRSFPEFCYYHF